MGGGSGSTTRYRVGDTWITRRPVGSRSYGGYRTYRSYGGGYRSYRHYGGYYGPRFFYYTGGFYRPHYVYRSGFSLGLVIATVPSYGYGYYDSYCGIGFSSLDLYYDHCLGHHHPTAILVVDARSRAPLGTCVYDSGRWVVDDCGGSDGGYADGRGERYRDEWYRDDRYRDDSDRDQGYRDDRDDDRDRQYRDDGDDDRYQDEDDDDDR